MSPYELTTTYTGRDTTAEYYFALKNFSFNNKAQLDTFVLKKLPRQLLKPGHAINFSFYKYEKGHIDENFVHKDQPKQQNLFMEGGAKLIITYTWIEDKFMGVSNYGENGYTSSEKRNW